jgi:glycosyltransferase involved in cell wall biosynthesis
MHIEKLSLYIITLNEERRLGAVLESAKDLVDEIVVVDSGSTDRTEEIAKSYGARFLFHEWESDGPQVKWAEEHCSYRWVMRLDADEVISPELGKELREIRQNGTKDAYILRISDMYPGMKHVNPWIKHYKRLIRLYCRDAWTMSGEMSHDDVIKVRPDATYGRSKNFIEHYSFINIQQVVKKYDAESIRLVRRAVVQEKKYSPWRMVGISTLEFLKFYILGRFFLLGWWGFIHCVNIGYLRFLKFAKYYEFYHNPNVDMDPYIRYVPPERMPEWNKKNDISGIKK